MKDKKLGINNMNSVSEDADTTCSFTDMNCTGGEESKASINDMNGVAGDDDTTCSFTDMNCTGE